jgi:thiamine kinase-like enzyme
MKKSYVKQLEEQNEQLRQKLAAAESRLVNKEYHKEAADWLYRSFVGGLVYEMARNVGKNNKVNVKKMEKLCVERIQELLCGCNGSFYYKQQKEPSYWKKYLDIIEPCIKDRMTLDKRVDKMLADMDAAIEGTNT